MSVISNIMRVMFANVFNLGSSFIVGFILPAYLSVNEYGMYRQFTLYLSFVFIFNFGFNDGIFIKYGGKSGNEIDEIELLKEHSFINAFQLIISLIMLVVSLVLKNQLFILFSVATFFVTMFTYHRNFLQATGEFKVYSRSNIIQTVANIITILFVVFVLKSNQSVNYILATIVTQIITYAFMEYYFIKSYGLKFIIGKKGILKNFKVGIFILIANLSMSFIGNVGAWITNIGLSVYEFAQYSFSISMLNIILMIINSVGLVFYNVISKNKNEQMLNFIKTVLLILGVFGGIFFFIFKIIITSFLSKYVDSILLFSITFISIPYIMVANVIINNLYKARNDERKYFKDSLLLAVFALLFVGIIFVATHSVKMIAFATTAVYILWYLYSTEHEFNFLKNTKKEISLLVSHAIVFYFTANFLSSIQGIIIYAVYLLIIMLLFKNEFMKGFSYFRKEESL